MPKTKSPQEKDKHLEKLEQQVEALQQKADEYLNGWKRAQADYANLQSEQNKRREEMAQFANAAVLAELLPILNHYKLAWQHVPVERQSEEWLRGFEYIRKQFEEFLKKFGIEEIPTVGKKFNPEFHEAVAHEEQVGFEPDMIFEEAAPGYTLHGKVLAPAKVKVAK
jgi:molecular chaperone GrpE